MPFGLKGSLLKYAFLLALAASIFAPSPAHALDLCVKLKWLHQSQFAGFYVAQDEGLYKAAGLNVTLVEGGPVVNWQTELSAPSCPIGITNAYELVIASSKGLPVKAVAAIDQISPIVWFSLQESGIWSPRQFRGKRVVLVPTGKLQLYGMLEKVGVKMSEVSLKGFSLDMSPMYDGEVDVWSGYHTNLVTKAEAEGHVVNIIHPADYGVQIYDDVVYVTEEFMHKHPAEVKAFLEATLQGWHRAIEAPAVAAAYSARRARDNGIRHQEGLLVRSIPYIHNGEVPIGWMEGEVWADIIGLTRKAGMIGRSPAPSAVFTDRFLLEIYPGVNVED